MQVSVETGGAIERRLRVTVPSTEVESAIAERLRNLSRTAKIPGFRPGKTPMAIIDKRFRSSVTVEIYEDLVQRTYSKAIVDQGLRPAGQPDVRIEASGPGQDFSYLATIEIYPEFEPTIPTQTKVERWVAQIGEADIEKTLQNLREQRKTYVQTDRAAAMDDQVLVDFVGTIDGNTFQGGSAEDITLVLGARRTVVGFEDGMVGMKAGDRKTITIQFQADYGNAEVAGREAKFDIHMKQVLASHLPEIDAAFVEALGIAEGGIEALRRDVLDTLQREASKASKTRLKGGLMDALLAANPLDLPNQLVLQEKRRLHDGMGHKHSHGDDGDCLTDPSLDTEARRRVALGLILAEVAQRHQIRVEPAAVRAELERVALEYDDPDSVRNWYLSSPQRLDQIEALVLENTLVDWLATQVQIQDVPVSFDRLIGRPEAA